MGVISDYYKAAKKYEENRLKAIEADAHSEAVKQLFSNVGKSFPAVKKDHYPNTKIWDLAQSFFKNRDFRYEMKSRFEEWTQEEISQDKEAVERKMFVSMCKDLETTCLVFDRFHDAKKDFQNETVKRIKKGFSLEEIQKEIGDLGHASRKASQWYSKFQEEAL